MQIKLDIFSVKNINKTGRYSTPEKGLFLRVFPNGKKQWVLRYTFDQKRHDLSFGCFPEIGVADARKKALDARLKINNGTNPIEAKKARKKAFIEANTPKINFAKFAIEIIEQKRSEWTNAKHAEQWEYTLKQYAFPVIGHKQLDEINTQDICNILEPIWKTKTETASRLRGRLQWILAAAITKSLRKEMNPALWQGHLQTLLPSPNKIKQVTHHKALPYKDLPNFIQEVIEREGVSALALEFLILNANRSSEVTGAKRAEVENGIWKIPANRMKARTEHSIPLCKRSLEIIEIAKLQDPESIYLFSRKGKPISNMAMPMLLRKMQLEVTVHGFRSTFRDWVAEETDHSPEVAEMALAHTIGNKVEAAYRRGILLERRRKLMADWEEYCYSKQNPNIIKLKAA